MDSKALLLNNNRPKVPLIPQIGVAHTTATPNVDARTIRTWFDNPTAQVSAHAIVDWNEVIICVPYAPGSAEVAWHAGPTANALSIGVELCETTEHAKFIASYRRYCDLWASICRLWGWTADRIWGHWMVSAYWGEVDHTDPLPYFRKYDITWWDFLGNVVSRLSGPAKHPDAPILVRKVPLHVDGQCKQYTAFLGNDNLSYGSLRTLAAAIGLPPPKPVMGTGGLVAVDIVTK